MHLPLAGSQPACPHSPELSQTMPSHFCTHTPLLARCRAALAAPTGQCPRRTTQLTSWWPRHSDSCTPVPARTCRPSHFCTHTPLPQVPSGMGTVTSLVEADNALTSGGLALGLSLALRAPALLAITLLHTHAIAASAEWHQQITGLVEADNALNQWWPRTQTPGTLCSLTAGHHTSAHTRHRCQVPVASAQPPALLRLTTHSTSGGLALKLLALCARCTRRPSHFCTADAVAASAEWHQHSHRPCLRPDNALTECVASHSNSWHSVLLGHLLAITLLHTDAARPSASGISTATRPC